ncbi:MAG: hypothetical protein K2X38_12645 [Gemmataceae bacterium]|nr:hypothetical protein [Gemmataceae bacterium]
MERKRDARRENFFAKKHRAHRASSRHASFARGSTKHRFHEARDFSYTRLFLDAARRREQGCSIMPRGERSELLGSSPLRKVHSSSGSMRTQEFAALAPGLVTRLSLLEDQFIEPKWMSNTSRLAQLEQPIAHQ